MVVSRFLKSRFWCGLILTTVIFIIGCWRFIEAQSEWLWIFMIIPVCSFEILLLTVRRKQPVTSVLGICIVLSLALFCIGVAKVDWIHYPGQAGPCLLALWVAGPPQSVKWHFEIEGRKADQSLERAKDIIKGNKDATQSETALMELEDGAVSLPRPVATRRY